MRVLEREAAPCENLESFMRFHHLECLCVMLGLRAYCSIVLTMKAIVSMLGLSCALFRDQTKRRHHVGGLFVWSGVPPTSIPCGRVT